VDASTPPSRTPTLRPIATTLLGNASISTGRWKPPTRHKMLLLAVEPPRHEKTPGRLGMTVKSTPLHKKTEPRKLRSYESSRQSLTRIASALFYLSRSSRSTCLTRLVEVSVDGLKRYIGRSSETERLSSPSAVSLGRARTSWRQQCCCAICPNHQTPKRDAFETRCRLCSKWR